PVVWALQYGGGAAPQWGGRYLLVSGLVLAALGAAALPALPRATAVALVVLAVSVTAFGLWWLSVRSHGVARAGAALAALPEPVVVSTVGHLARELGASYGERRWLTATRPGDLAAAAEVVAAAGLDRFALVAGEGPPPPAVGRFELAGTQSLALFEGVDLVVASYRARW
ncbi:MAG: hypothetical protein ACRD0M_11275, partial [Acidimicrobiales bacterium]